MKKIFLFFLLAFALIAQDADAQSKKVTKKKTTSSKSKDKKGEEADGSADFWTEKMMYGAFVNYPLLGRGVFNMSLSPMIGYKVHKNVAAGLITSVNYTWARNTNFAQPPINLVDLGIGIFARAKLFNVVLFHADYQRTNYKIPTDLSTNPITVVNYPLTSAKIGVGYLQGFSKWKFEAGIYYDALFDVNKSVRDSPFEYRGAITYNF